MSHVIYSVPLYTSLLVAPFSQAHPARRLGNLSYLVPLPTNTTPSTYRATEQIREGKQAGASAGQQNHTIMADSQMYSSRLAAQDVARGACIVAWPADEPYTEPTVAHSPRQPRFYAGPNSASNNNGGALQASTSCPSFASRTSVSQDGRSERSVSLPSNSSRASSDGLV